MGRGINPFIKLVIFPDEFPILYNLEKRETTW